MPQPVRVLLCDDVAMLRELLRYELEEDDDVVVVGEADNGIDGVRLAAELEPDVVVLDLGMPGLDGLEALGRMRQAPHPPTVIVHSGFDAETMRPRVMALGAVAYLEKGGKLGDVRAAIRDLIDSGAIRSG